MTVYVDEAFRGGRIRFSSGAPIQLVEHLVRDEGVAGSNPATPTNRINYFHLSADASNRRADKYAGRNPLCARRGQPLARASPTKTRRPDALAPRGPSKLIPTGLTDDDPQILSTALAFVNALARPRQRSTRRAGGPG
jgi:hypothetical protein